MIHCENISFAYDGQEPVLNHLYLELKPGFTLLVGPNGCGKSTLLRLLAGVEMPDSGQIFINGANLWEEEVKTRAQLVYFPEYPDLTPYATIKEIITLVCRLRQLPPEKGMTALKETEMLPFLKRKVRELSNGQRRRVIFACCLLGNPSVILLDEPLEGMDQKMQTQILHWLSQKSQDKTTILLTTHNVTPFLRLVNHTLTIKNQKIYPHFP